MLPKKILNKIFSDVIINMIFVNITIFLLIVYHNISLFCNRFIIIFGHFYAVVLFKKQFNYYYFY